MPTPRWNGGRVFFSSWRLAREAEQLNRLRLEVTELTERADNAIKFLSDMYYARAYRLAANKVGAGDYRSLVDQKLRTAGELYEFMVNEFRDGPRLLPGAAGNRDPDHRDHPHSAGEMRSLQAAPSALSSDHLASSSVGEAQPRSDPLRLRGGNSIERAHRPGARAELKHFGPVLLKRLLVELDAEARACRRGTACSSRCAVCGRRARTRTGRGRGWRTIPECSRWEWMPADGRAAPARDAAPS